MASVNKAILIGNLGSDPEVRYTPGGQAVANFRIATNDVWTDKSGQKQERTEWHRIVVWGKQAEACGEFLSKGRSVYVDGRLQTREWTDKEGHKNWTTEVVANRVEFLGGTGAGAGGRRQGPSPEDFGPPPPGVEDAPAGTPGGAAQGQPQGGGAPGGGPGEDDIPF